MRKPRFVDPEMDRGFWGRIRQYARLSTASAHHRLEQAAEKRRSARPLYDAAPAVRAAVAPVGASAALTRSRLIGRS
jgi:hypothetical protein